MTVLDEKRKKKMRANVVKSERIPGKIKFFFLLLDFWFLEMRYY